MVKFEVVESDFWGYLPTKREYELREDVVGEFRFMIGTCLADPAGNMFRRNRVVSGVKVSFGIEVSKHFNSCQFVFRARKRQETIGSFVAYCMCAVHWEFKALGSATVQDGEGFVEVTVALPQQQAVEVCSFVHFMLTGEELELSTTVYTL